jgi:glycosyltransferase involved in cell wall biosynthesis
MRIAVFIKRTTLHKGQSGLETQNLNLCEGLAKKGYEVVVFSPKLELTQATAEANGVKYVFVPATLRYLFAEYNRDSWENKSVEVFKKYHAEKKFDLVLGQSSGGIGIVKHKAELGVKVISIAHGTALGEIKTFLTNVSSAKDIVLAVKNLQYFLRQYFGRQREFILGSDKVIAVSNAIKKQLLDETFVPEEKVVVINNGIATVSPTDISARFAPDRKDKLTLLYIGQVAKDKGCDLFVPMFKDFTDYAFKLHVVGVGSYSEILKKTVVENNLTEKVIIHGWKPYSEARALFNSTDFDAFIFPTKRMEGFPMVLVEAMIGGLPVVAFDMGGVPDAIDASTGFVLPPGRFDLFKEALLKLYQDVGLRQQISTAAREKAYRSFTIEHMLEQYVATMEALK